MASIPIANHSFEDPALAPGDAQFNIPNWTCTQDGAGVFHPSASVVVPTHGNQTAFVLPNAQVAQVLSAVLTAETTYTLQVDALARTDSIAWAGATVQLLAGGVVLGSDVSGPGSGAGGLAPGAVKTITVTYAVPPGAPQLGQALEIRVVIGGAVGQSIIDNVRLTAIGPAPPPPTISAVTQPQAGNANPQPLTISGSNFPTPPTVTILDPNLQAISVSVTSASASSIVVEGVFYPHGEYTVKVNDSDPFPVQSLPPLPPPPTITGVQSPQAGESGLQSITITGTNFPTPPSVTITDPTPNPVSVSVTAASSTSITVQGVFFVHGTYSAVVSGSEPFPFNSLPPIVPGATITGVSPRPTSGFATPQALTISGTNFPSPPTVTITGPDQQTISVDLVSHTSTSIVVTGVFQQAGTYSVKVNDSPSFAFDSAAPVITSITPPTSGVVGNQELIITGSGFRANPTVTATAPHDAPVSLEILSSTFSSIFVRGVFEDPGTYVFQVNDSLPFPVASIAPPEITSVTPTPIHGGSPPVQDISIHGSGFPLAPVVTVTVRVEDIIVNVPVMLTFISGTEIIVRGSFSTPGDYSFVVSGSPPFPIHSIPPPPTITDVQAPYHDQPLEQGITISGYGFSHPPTVTVTDPNGQTPTFHVAGSDPAGTWVVLLGVFMPEGLWTFSVDGSPPFAVPSNTFIGLPTITDVTPPQAGDLYEQTLVITGTNFPVPRPTVFAVDPYEQSVPISLVLPTSTTQIVIRGTFVLHGRWQFRVGQMDPFFVDSLPPTEPVATIHDVTPQPQGGMPGTQFLTIVGTRFNLPPHVVIRDTAGNTVPFTQLSASPTAIVISGVFDGPRYEFLVDNSQPFGVDTLPPSGAITGVSPRPQAGLTTPQRLTITGTDFNLTPLVSIRGPLGPVTFSVVSTTATEIVVDGVFQYEGNYFFSVDGSPEWPVVALPIPIPTITSITQPQSGLTTAQPLTIAGDWYLAPITVTVTGPQGNVPVTVTHTSKTALDISGVFLHPGIYSVIVKSDTRQSLPFPVQALAPAPPVITSVTRPQAGLTSTQTVTLQTTGYLTGPTVTVTDRDGVAVPVSVISAPQAPLGGPITVSGVFFLEGNYRFVVDGSIHYDVTAIPVPVITSVEPPQAGETAPQDLVITGTNFPVGSTVTVLDPNNQPLSVSVINSSATSITVRGIFFTPGDYTFRAGLAVLSPPFSVTALTPIPVITSLAPQPQSGLDITQNLTITGVWFRDPPDVVLRGPDGVQIPVTVVSNSANLVVISAVFFEEGFYSVTVNNSAPASIEALAIPPPKITAVSPFQAGISESQDLRISGTWFPENATVRVQDPLGNELEIEVYDQGGKEWIDIGGVFWEEGVYTFWVGDSAPFQATALAPPPPPPPPIITDVTRPQSGQTTPQLLTITGTGFVREPPTVTVLGPDGVAIPVTVVSTASTTQIVISGVFVEEGLYTVIVDGSVPFLVQALAPIVPPPPFQKHPIRRLRQFLLPSSPDNRRIQIARLELLLRTGIGIEAAPGEPGRDPQVMMQLSRDGGKTWGPEQWRSAGEQGDYLRRCRWLRQGQYRNAVIRLATSDPVDWQWLSLSGDLTEGSS